jgi:hypothetical protein
MGKDMAKEQEEQEEPGFTVTDKRSFTVEGERRQEEDEKAPQPADSPAADAPDAAESIIGEGPQIDFPSYLLSYYTQGLVLLGEVPNPMTNKKEQDMEGARHTIDILSMLQDKTKGNLSKEEDQLLDSVLYELRMKFMAKMNRIKL